MSCLENSQEDLTTDTDQGDRISKKYNKPIITNDMEDHKNEIKKKIKRFVMRKTGEPESKGFWISPTRDGFSLGLVSDNEEDLHLTIYSKNGINDAHITNAKGEHRQKDPITRLSDNVLREKMDNIANEGMQKTYHTLPPDEDVIVIDPAVVERGKTIMQKAFKIHEEGKTAYLDIDADGAEKELLELGSPENWFYVVKVKDLKQMQIESAFTKDWKLVIVTENNVLACNCELGELDKALEAAPSNTSYESIAIGPIVEFLKLLGLKQLTDKAKEKGLL